MALSTRTVNISLRFPTNQTSATITFIPDFAAGDGQVLLEETYSKTLTASAPGSTTLSSTISLPVLNDLNKSLGYRVKFPRETGYNEHYIYLSKGSPNDAIDLSTLLNVATNPVMEGGVTGQGEAGKVAYWSDSDTITSSQYFAYDSTTVDLTVGDARMGTEGGVAGACFGHGATYGNTGYALQQDQYGNTYVNFATNAGPTSDGLFFRADNSRTNELNFDGTYWQFRYNNTNYMNVRMHSDGKFAFNVYGTTPKFYFNGKIESDGNLILNNNAYLRAGSAAMSKVLIQRLDEFGVPVAGESVGGGGFAYFDYDGATECNYLTTDQYALQQDILGNTYLNAGEGWDPDTDTATNGRLYLRNANSKNQQMVFDGGYWNVEQWNADVKQYHMSMRMASTGKFEFNVYADAGAGTPKFYFNGATDFDGNVVIGNNSYLRAGSAAISKVLIEKLDTNGDPLSGTVGGGGFAYFDYDGATVLNYLNTTDYAIQQDVYGNTYVNAGAGWNPVTDTVTAGRLYLRNDNSKNQQMVFDGAYWNIEQWTTNVKQYHMSMQMASTGRFEFNVYADDGVDDPKFYFNGQIESDGNIIVGNNAYIRAGSAAMSKVLIQRLDEFGVPIAGQSIGGGGFAYFDYDGATECNYLTTDQYALQQDILGNTYLNAGEGWDPDTDSATDGRLYLRHANSLNQQLAFDGLYWNIEQWDGSDKQYHMSMQMADTGQFEFNVYADEGVATPKFYFNGAIDADGNITVGNNAYVRAGSAVLSKVLIQRLDEFGVPIAGESIGGGGMAYFDYDGAHECNYLTTDQYAIQQDMLGNTYVNAGEGWDPDTDTPTSGRLYLRHANSLDQQLAFDGLYWNIEQWDSGDKQYHMSMQMADTGQFEFNVYADAGLAEPKFYFNGNAHFEGDIDLGNTGAFITGDGAFGGVDGDMAIAFRGYDASTPPNYIDYLTDTDYAVRQNELGDTFVNAATGGRLFFRLNNTETYQYTYDGEYWTHWYDINTKMSTKMNSNGKFEFNVYAASPNTPYFWFNGLTHIEGNVELGNNGVFVSGDGAFGGVDGDMAIAFRGYDASTPAVYVDHLTATNYAVRQNEFGDTYVNAKAGRSLAFSLGNAALNSWTLTSDGMTFMYDSTHKVKFSVTADGYLNILTGNSNQAVLIGGNGATTIGAITEGAVADARKLDLTGAVGNNTPGNYKNNKLVLYRNNLNTAYYGLGISTGLLEVQSAGDIAFYAEDGVETKTERMRVAANGDFTLGDALVKTTSISINGPTADQVLTSISATTYRSVKYEVQVTSGSDVHVTEIRVVHDGTTCYITEYGTMWSNASLATFSADIDSGNLRLLTTPTSGTKTFKILTRALKA